MFYARDWCEKHIGLVLSFDTKILIQLPNTIRICFDLRTFECEGVLSTFHVDKTCLKIAKMIY